MNELKNQGLQDILIAVVDGLKGFPEAITAAFPEAMVQTCPRHGHSDQWRSHGSMHLVRHSLNFCSWKDRKAVAADLRRIYSAPTAAMAEAELNAFEERWGGPCYFQVYEFVENGANLQQMLDEERELHRRTKTAPTSDPGPGGQVPACLENLGDGIQSASSDVVVVTETSTDWSFRPRTGSPI